MYLYKDLMKAFLKDVEQEKYTDENGKVSTGYAANTKIILTLSKIADILQEVLPEDVPIVEDNSFNCKSWHCSACGYEADSDANFCSHCGRRFI